MASYFDWSSATRCLFMWVALGRMIFYQSLEWQGQTRFSLVGYLIGFCLNPKKSLEESTEIYIPVSVRMSLKNYPIDVKLQCICVKSQIKASVLIFGLLLLLLIGFITFGCIYNIRNWRKIAFYWLRIKTMILLGKAKLRLESTWSQKSWIIGFKWPFRLINCVKNFFLFQKHFRSIKSKNESFGFVTWPSFRAV